MHNALLQAALHQNRRVRLLLEGDDPLLIPFHTVDSVTSLLFDSNSRLQRFTIGQWQYSRPITYRFRSLEKSIVTHDFMRVLAQ